MKLSEESLLVLASLVAGPKHGYAIIADVAEHTGERFGPGTLYGIIARLESAGLIAPLEVEDRGRRPYRVTPAGKRAFDQRMAHLKTYARTLKALAAQ